MPKEKKPAPAPETTPRAAQRLEQWPVERLKPYERNARTHSPEQIEKLAASIREFGFTAPVLVDSDDGILAGHGRLEAAKKIGLQTIPVVVLDHLTEKQRRAYILADNRIALDAGWNVELLSSELLELKIDVFDMDLIGFTALEIENLMNPANAADQSPAIEDFQEDKKIKIKFYTCPYCEEEFEEKQAMVRAE